MALIVSTTEQRPLLFFAGGTYTNAYANNKQPELIKGKTIYKLPKLWAIFNQLSNLSKVWFYYIYGLATVWKCSYTLGPNFNVKSENE